ncbi:MAG: hypothetical protein NVSMB42_07340 [Herpetosiphon sp.]
MEEETTAVWGPHDFIDAGGGSNGVWLLSIRTSDDEIVAFKVSDLPAIGAPTAYRCVADELTYLAGARAVEI